MGLFGLILPTINPRKCLVYGAIRRLTPHNQPYNRVFFKGGCRVYPTINPVKGRFKGLQVGMFPLTLAVLTGD